MANSKKSDSTKPIQDVAHPDTSAAEASSKPILVTNRPIMKDPMVKEDNGTEVEEADKTAIPQTHENVIEPLSAPELKGAKVDVKTDKKEEKPELKIEPIAEKKPVETPPNEDSTKTAEVQKEPEVPAEVEPAKQIEDEKKPETSPAEETPAEPEAENKKEAEASSDVAPTEPVEDKKQPETSQAEETKDETTPSETAETAGEEPKTDNPENPADATKAETKEKTAKEIEAAEAKKKAEHEEAINKLADSKKYSLPINTIEKKRSKRHVALGVLVSLILIVAWADVALDAGLVKVNSNIPHTNFFSKQSSPTTTAATTAGDNVTIPFKSYTFTVSQLKIRYPGNWVINSSNSTASTDNVLITPPAKSSGTNTNLGAISVNFTNAGSSTATGNYEVKSVSYDKINNAPITTYLRDIVYVDQSSGAIGVNSALVNTNVTKIGDTLTSLTPTFSRGDSAPYQFVISVNKQTTKGSGFTTTAQAKNFIQQTESYQQAETIVSSLSS